MSVAVRRADSGDVQALAPLFDTYRGFYGQPSDLALANGFLAQRLGRGDSVVLVAGEEQALLGFTQLYPSFSSVQARRTWILNDLFVEASARRRGIGRLLLRAAADFARSDGALRLELETDHDNAAAQALYESLGWARYDHSQRYHLPL